MVDNNLFKWEVVMALGALVVLGLTSSLLIGFCSGVGLLYSEESGRPPYPSPP